VPALTTTVHQCVSVSVCQYVSMSVHQYISTSVHQYISTSVYQYVSMSVYLFNVLFNSLMQHASVFPVSPFPYAYVPPCPSSYVPLFYLDYIEYMEKNMWYTYSLAVVVKSQYLHYISIYTNCISHYISHTTYHTLCTTHYAYSQ
jgi:hypothetical protein